MLRLTLLGPPAVSRDGEPVQFDTRKAIALLAVLAVEDRAQPRDRLAALLWPDSDATKARSALRRTLSVTTTAVGDALAVDRALVSLRADASTSDVAEFRALAGRSDVASLRRAADLYRDDFLAGFRLRDSAEFDDWLVDVAGSLRRQLANVLSALVDASIAAKDLDGALNDAHRWLSLDPLHEPAHHALIRLHAWRGDRSSAMRQYRSCVRILDAELGVEPLDETKALYDAVRRNQLPAAAPAPAPSGPTLTTTDAGVRPASLVGRDNELSLLRQALSGRGDQRGVVVSVTGPTGVGKSALLGQADHAVATDGVTIAVRCHPEESALAFGVLLELARGVVMKAPDSLERLSRAARAELARLVPEVAELDGPAGGGDDPAAVARLYAAMRDLLVATTTPVTLVVDDAQWLDSASSDALAYLVRRLPTTRVALLLAWSTDALAQPSTVMRAAADGVADGYGIAVVLRPLDAATLHALVDADPALIDVDVERLVAETGGLPSLVMPFLDVVRRGGDPESATSAVARELLEHRLSRLSQTAQQVIAAAAVIAGRADIDLLRDISGRGDTETAEAIEESLHAGLLVNVAGGDGYDVSLEALRNVVIEQTAVARRRLLHDRAARALERRAGARVTPADAGAIARHLAEAGRRDEAAEWHWRAAVEARSLHAHEQALADVRAALGMGHPTAPARLAEGEILIALGRYRDAISVLELAAAASSSDEHAVQVERRLADVHHRLGDYAAAEAHVAAALELAAGREDPDVASLLADHALLAYRIGDLETAERDGAQALAVAERIGDDDAVANALNVLGVIAVGRDDLDRAAETFHEARRRATGDTDPGIGIAVLNNLARLQHRQNNTAEALVTAREALERGRLLGDRHRVAALHTNLADLLRADGDRDAAMEHLKTAAAIFGELDDAEQRRPGIWTLVEW